MHSLCYAMLLHQHAHCPPHNKGHKCSRVVAMNLVPEPLAQGSHARPLADVLHLIAAQFERGQFK